MTQAANEDARQPRETSGVDRMLENIAQLRKACAHAVPPQRSSDATGTVTGTTKWFLAELSRIERHLHGLVQRGTDGDMIAAAEAISAHMAASARRWCMLRAMEHAAPDLSQPKP